MRYLAEIIGSLQAGRLSFFEGESRLQVAWSFGGLRHVLDQSQLDPAERISAEGKLSKLWFSTLLGLTSRLLTMQLLATITKRV